MKAFLSIALGLVLLTSLVGISYATPLVQPAQNNSGDVNACVNLKPNDPSYYTLGCAGAAHQNGNDNPPQHACFVGQKADSTCCVEGFTPHSLEISDIQADPNGCER